jgi:Ca2+-binding EF-hand superfamily protein
LDINGDGTLSKDEIRAGYKFSNKSITNEELDYLIMTVDSNKNNAINYKEFMVASLNRRELLTDARIDSCFKLFDRVNLNL